MEGKTKIKSQITKRAKRKRRLLVIFFLKRDYFLTKPGHGQTLTASKAFVIKEERPKMWKPITHPLNENKTRIKTKEESKRNEDKGDNKKK